MVSYLPQHLFVYILMKEQWGGGEEQKTSKWNVQLRYMIISSATWTIWLFIQKRYTYKIFRFMFLYLYPVLNLTLAVACRRYIYSKISSLGQSWVHLWNLSKSNVSLNLICLPIKSCAKAISNVAVVYIDGNSCYFPRPSFSIRNNFYKAAFCLTSLYPRSSFYHSKYI